MQDELRSTASSGQHQAAVLRAIVDCSLGSGLRSQSRVVADFDQEPSAGCAIVQPLRGKIGYHSHGLGSGPLRGAFRDVVRDRIRRELGQETRARLNGTFLFAREFLAQRAEMRIISQYSTI